MDQKNLFSLTVSETIPLIQSGVISVTQSVNSCIERIAQKETEVEAWSYFNPDIVLKNAAIIDDKIKRKENPGSLYGALVGIKDIFNTIDMPTSMGSEIWKNFTPGNDARVIHYIREQNGIVAGKTVTAEFAVHQPNQTRNPWNKNHSPGTSSSGSAAAVAAGMVPMSLGTQTAGSIIRPASYCGCYGFKPTFGTIPRTGMLKTTDTLDSIGLFARSANDCRLLFDTIRVKGPDYPLIHKFLNDPHRQHKNSDKWKVGIITDQFWTYENTFDYSRKEFGNLVAQLQKMNDVVLEMVSVDEDWAAVHEHHRIVYHKCLSYYFKEEFKNQSQISPIMTEIISEGNRITPEQYQASLKKQIAFTSKIDALFNEYDVILTLSTAGEAPVYGTAIDPPDTCLIWTFAGTPSLNVPAFTSPNKMPYGLQVISRKYCDYKLFSFVEFLIDKKIIANRSSSISQ